MTTEQKFDCVFCQETFEDKETLQTHFRKHGDPKFDQSTKSIKASTPAEKNGEEIEMVGCDVCEEVFPTISKAITHKHKAHPDQDTKYFCPFCGKLFTMKHLHNKHIQSNHGSEEVTGLKDFHCDMCNVTFNAPSAMLYHNKFFHRQDTEIPAIGTSKKVKLFNQEMIQVYYCSFCGEEFNNKVNLHKHIGDDHCEENQSPNEVLRCPLCEAIFYHLDAYEIHITFHSSEDLYSEKNDIFDQITEFSLETVAPIMENVIEEDVTQPEQDNGNSDGINNFLQLVMGDQGDNFATEKIKHKKHKKHKKSKKASITLDEFLNMNKDVFGDSIGDVQGIEEVPTQVVLKKVKKPQNKMVNADLAKLKKQGIVVKAKSKNTSITNLNIQKARQLVSTSVQNKLNTTQESPNDILSKLMTQGNSQIKIVKKKSVSLNNDNEDSGTNAQSIETNKNPIERTTENTDTKSNIPEKAFGSPTGSPTPNTEVPSKVNESRNEVFKRADIDSETIADNQFTTKCSEVTKYENVAIVKKLNSFDDKFASSSPGNPLTPEIKNNMLVNHQDKEEIDEGNVNDEDHAKDCHEEKDTNQTTKTINVLKHLSHLITVKPASLNKNAIPKNVQEEEKSKEDNSDAGNENQLSENTNTKQNNPLNKLLKSCGQITVKKQIQSPSRILPYVQSDSNIVSELQDELENNDNLKLEKDSDTTNINKEIIEMKELKLELVPLSASICNKFLFKNSIKYDSNEILKEEQTIKEQKEGNIDSPKKESNLDILKRLTNVTTKPVNVTKVINQQPVNVKPNQTYMSQVKGLHPTNISKGIDKDIEVFNIDDSDDEAEGDALSNHNEAKQSDVFNNLSRNINVKSSETKTTPSLVKNIKLQTNNTRSDSNKESYTQIKQSKEIQKSINLQNKLKTLDNLTIKSNNASTNVYNKNFEDYDEQAESGSDSENIGGVKICEVSEDYMSDNEVNDVHPKAMIQSPNASNSEPEENHEDFDYDLPDFENDIKTNTLKKNEQTVLKNPKSDIDNLKTLNKALTIKSLNARNAEEVSNADSDRQESEETDNSALEMALKLYKPTATQSDLAASKNTLQASGSSSQTTLNQKVNTASNQVNTVKTVKRFQSQTVIEEITTTVTKTIRTVNSSTNEVMQSTSQNTPKPIIRPQKILNKQVGRELQGTAVRHASPTIGTKIRNAVSVARFPNTTIVRPSNQLVPARPVFHRPRFPTLSISSVKKIAPPRCSPQRPPIGKLKISPHALNQSTKRHSDEAFAHSSPFKKPKDLLAASKDLPDFGDDADDSSMQYSSTSQSRSDFSSIMKKTKGMVTATQMRSEVSTSSQQQVSKGIGMATQMRSEVSTSSQQQLNKLNSVSGLKVVKTSTKQAMQLEERCEISPTKKNTLEAIEKLQRQGLLVKKPRIDDQANPFSDSDDEFGE